MTTGVTSASPRSNSYFMYGNYALNSFNLRENAWYMMDFETEMGY